MFGHRFALNGPDCPEEVDSRARSQGGNRPPASPAPAPRATALRAQERGGRRRRTHHLTQPHAQEAARPATRPARPATARLLPLAGRRTGPRPAARAALLLVLWPAVRPFP